MAEFYNRAPLLTPTLTENAKIFLPQRVILLYDLVMELSSISLHPHERTKGQAVVGYVHAATLIRLLALSRVLRHALHRAVQ